MSGPGEEMKVLVVTSYFSLQRTSTSLKDTDRSLMPLFSVCNSLWTCSRLPEPPEIQLDVKLLAGLTARAGTKMELPADVKGKPDPRVKWTKADLVLTANERISIDTQPGHSKLSISNTTRGDSATYIIEAVNNCGRATATVDVNILGVDAVFFTVHCQPVPGELFFSRCF